MAQSKSSFGRFKGSCPSCKCRDAKDRGKCPKCGAFAKADGSAWFRSGVKVPDDLMAKSPSEPVKPVTGSPVEPVPEPVKKPVKTTTGSPSVSPSTKRSPSNEAQEPVKSPCQTPVEPVKARVEPVPEPVREPVRARQNGFDVFDIF